MARLRRRSCAAALLLFALAAIAGCTPPPAAAPAEDTSQVWNFTPVDLARGADGSADRHSFSKLAPWPLTDGRTLFTGCYDPVPLMEAPAEDRCFGTVDLADPEHPKWLATVYTYDPVASPAPPAGHAIWRADYPFPNLPARAPCRVDWNESDIAAGRTPPPCWDPGWNTHTHYVARGPGGLLAVNQERYRLDNARQVSYRGVKFYDVSDPAQPTFLSYWEAPTSPPDPKTGAYPDMDGAHHFNFDGRYLYLGTEYRGFIGRILVILDLADPTRPREAGRWWIPGQKTPEEDGVRDWVQQHWSQPVVRRPDGRLTKHLGMHYATPYGDVVYLSYNQAGLVVLDVRDKSRPRLISRTDYLVPGAEPDAPDAAACRASAGGQPAACGNAHSAKLVPGRPNLLVMSDEYFRCPYGHMRIFDVADPARPALRSHFLLPETAACDPERPRQMIDAARFPRRGPSTHIGNAWNADLYLMAWYGAGLRAIDIRDPARPREVGRYQYEISGDFPDAERSTKEEALGGLLVGPDVRPGRRFAGQDTYDVVFGPGGQIYLSDGTAGLRVLRYMGPLAIPGPLSDRPR
jgi:hypothetical protein